MNVANVTVIKIFKKALTLFFFGKNSILQIVAFYSRELSFFFVILQGFTLANWLFFRIFANTCFRELLFVKVFVKSYFRELFLNSRNCYSGKLIIASVVAFLFLDMLLCYLIFVFYYQLCGSILEKKRLVQYHSFFS